jgi:hypothetical protein
MGELKRKEEQLSTADLAGRGDALNNVEQIDDPARPKPVRGTLGGDFRNEAAKLNDEAREDLKPSTSLDAGRSHANSPLFSESDVSDLRGRWSNVQAAFVDEPRRAVQDADNLVASVMKRLAEGFANERSSLEKQWDGGGDASTEDLRLALQRYRSFFDRLLNA